MSPFTTSFFVFSLAAVLCACGEPPLVVLLPDTELPPTLLFAATAGGPVEFFDLSPGRSLHVTDARLDGLLLLAFDCPDLDALGFVTAPDGYRKPPRRTVRAPTRLFRLETPETPTWVELPVDAASLSILSIEFRFPSFCLEWQIEEPSVAEVSPSALPIFVSAPDGSVIVFQHGANDPTLVRIFSPGEERSFELPPDIRVDAALFDRFGQLWIYDNDRQLRRGPPEGLEDIDGAFELSPRAPSRSPSCAGLSLLRKISMSVRAHTSTEADVLVLDSSGRLTRFRDGTWSVMSDVVGADPTSPFACGVEVPNVTWISDTEALSLNPTLGRQPVSLLRFLPDGTMTISDDDGPPAGISSPTFLDLGERGVYATSGIEGSVVHRSSLGWELIEDSASLSDAADILLEGPEGSVLYGNYKDGLRQYWPDRGVCRGSAANTGIRRLLRFGDEGYLSFGIEAGPVRSVRLAAPGLCEPHPD